jgi:hypothetical protein
MHSCQTRCEHWRSCSGFASNRTSERGKEATKPLLFERHSCRAKGGYGDSYSQLLFRYDEVLTTYNEFASLEESKHLLIIFIVFPKETILTGSFVDRKLSQQCKERTVMTAKRCRSSEPRRRITTSMPLPLSLIDGTTFPPTKKHAITSSVQDFSITSEATRHVRFAPDVTVYGRCAHDFYFHQEQEAQGECKKRHLERFQDPSSAWLTVSPEQRSLGSHRQAQQMLQ